MTRLLLICYICLSTLLVQGQELKEETVYIGPKGNELGGVLMFPQGKSKRLSVVLIIQGSGPTDKDGNSAALNGKNNSLRLLAEALAEEGIASLRFDKRGLGLSQKAATPESELVFDDFVYDAQAWLNFLIKDKRFKHIGIAGHSQGSLIGMRLSQNKEVIAFASIAGPSLSIDETILTQIKSNPFNSASIVKEAKSIFKQLENGNTVDSVPPYLLSVFRPSIQPFMMSWMKYDPLVEIEKLDIPTIIINGTTDLQVTVEDAQRLQVAKPQAQLVVIDGMNHVLKNASTNANENAASYSNPDLPLNRKFVETISSFFEKNLK